MPGFMLLKQAQTCATPFAPIPHESVELVTFVLDKFVAM